MATIVSHYPKSGSFRGSYCPVFAEEKEVDERWEKLLTVRKKGNRGLKFRKFAIIKMLEIKNGLALERVARYIFYALKIILKI